MRSNAKMSCRSRLSRIEGQVRSLSKMAEGEVLEDHISHCAEHAIRSGDKRAQREKAEELVVALARSRG